MTACSPLAACLTEAPRPCVTPSVDGRAAWGAKGASRGTERPKRGPRAEDRTGGAGGAFRLARAHSEGGSASPSLHPISVDTSAERARLTDGPGIERVATLGPVTTLRKPGGGAVSGDLQGRPAAPADTDHPQGLALRAQALLGQTWARQSPQMSPSTWHSATSYRGSWAARPETGERVTSPAFQFQNPALFDARTRNHGPRWRGVRSTRSLECDGRPARGNGCPEQEGERRFDPGRGSQLRARPGAPPHYTARSSRCVDTGHVYTYAPRLLTGARTRWSATERPKAVRWSREASKPTHVGRSFPRFRVCRLALGTDEPSPTGFPCYAIRGDLAGRCQVSRPDAWVMTADFSRGDATRTHEASGKGDNEPPERKLAGANPARVLVERECRNQAERDCPSRQLNQKGAAWSVRVEELPIGAHTAGTRTRQIRSWPEQLPVRGRLHGRERGGRQTMGPGAVQSPGLDLSKLPWPALRHGTGGHLLTRPDKARPRSPRDMGAGRSLENPWIEAAITAAFALVSLAGVALVAHLVVVGLK